MTIPFITYSDTDSEETAQELKAVLASNGAYSKLSPFEQRIADEAREPDYTPHRFDFESDNDSEFDSFRDIIGLDVRNMQQ